MQLSLSMICKGELDNLIRLQPLVTPFVDEWIVVVPPGDDSIGFLEEVGAKVIVKDFTQPVEAEMVEQFKEYGLDIPADYRLFNFAAARNESLKHATGTYVLWLDADDEPVGLGELCAILEKNTKVELFDVLYDYAKDAEDNSISNHIRERVFVNNGKFTWKGAKLGLIHETIVPNEGYTPLHMSVDPDVFRVIHHSDHADQSSMRNHIALLYEYLKTNGEDARTTYYLGVEFFNRGMYDHCIKILKEYVAVGGWDEERYRAWVRIAESYHQIGDKKSSRKAYLSALDELPHYPDAYLGLGESYFSDENWGKAIEFLMTGMQKEIPNTKSAVNMVKYTFRAVTFLALAHLNIGHPGEAYKWFAKAKQLNPKHPWVNKYSDLFREAKDLDDYVRGFVKVGQIASRLYPKTMGKLAEAIPDELKDQELLLAFKRMFTTPKIWPENSIVVFCSQVLEEWGPDSLKTGCGGSEEAVIHLTKRWAEMGWDVTVFNNCPEEKTVDGVKWKRFENFNPRDIFNVLVGWRNNPFLDKKVARKKFIDLHDVPSLKYFPEKALEDVTMVAKSQFHRSLFPHLQDNNFEIIPNGVDPEQFPTSTKKENNLVWTSSYDRGLEYLLEMWSDIRKEVPDATLDIAYGFNLFDQSVAGKSVEGQLWKENMLKLLDQEGVTHHGRLNSDDVAKLYLKADVFAYPTDFPEIDCISLTKAMTAKCIPITTDFAVLKERNQGIIVEGSGADPEVRKEFKQALITLLKDREQKQNIRNNIDVSQYSWDNTASAWDELFRR